MSRSVRRLGRDAVSFARYARGIRAHIEARLDAESCRARVSALLAGREESFVQVLEHAVFGQRRSPYRALFRHAGIELGDAVALVAEEGVEGALGRFHDAGVYLTVDEFKGRRPIVRGSLELPPASGAFDSRLGRPVFASSTGGSRGPATRTETTFAQLEENTAHTGLLLGLYGIAERPYVLWRPVPPAYAGLMSAVMFAKLGKRTERWFSQYPLGAARRNWRDDLNTRVTIAAARRAGMPIPSPEHVPLERAVVVARVLGELRAQGRPAFLNLPGSSGVRVCRAALEAGIDIAGTLLRFGGEPLTEAKEQAVRAAGAEVFCNYAMSEVGGIGLTCSERVERDEVHVVTSRLGVVQRDRVVGSGGETVGGLLYTTLLPTAKRILVNVESGDHGVLSQRACGCPLDRLGLSVHLHTIRSYEKLTSEGMSFAGRHLLALLEQALPARFGGGPSDYQLVEEEEDGLPKVHLVVSPGVGPLDEAEVVRMALDTLAARAPYLDLMSSLWRDGETLRVVRREPYQTSAAKVLPLHVLRR